MSPTQSDFPGSWRIHQKAPDVAIIGLDLIREMTQFTESPAHEDVFQWEVKAVPMRLSRDEWVLRLFGDLFVRQGHAVGAATSVATIAFRGASRPKLKRGEWTEELLAHYTEVYGSWLGHTLYDVAAAAVRRMSAQSHHESVEVPVETPEPVYLHDA